MSLTAITYAKETVSLNTILFAVGTAILIYIIQQAISRYLDYLKDREKRNDARNEKITTRLDALKDSFLEMSLKYSQMFEKVHSAGIKLDETVKKVGEMEIDVELLKQMNGLKKEKR